MIGHPELTSAIPSPSSKYLHMSIFPVVRSYLYEFFPLTTKILDSSKLKEFADDNFTFDENGRKLSKWVENTVGKGEIAHYEQFLLFPLCFEKICSADT